MNLKPLTIEEVLKHNVSYQACTPVILFDRSPWQKLVDWMHLSKLRTGLVLIIALISCSCSEPTQKPHPSLPAPIKLALPGHVTSPSLLHGHYLFTSTGMIGTVHFVEVGSEDLDGHGHYSFRSTFNAGGSVCLLIGEGTYELHGLRGFIRGKYRTESGTCGTGGDQGIIELSGRDGSKFYAASTETTATFIVEYERGK
jgi:hypothetical protein